jgi:hypothetical protein
MILLDLRFSWKKRFTFLFWVSCSLVNGYWYSAASAFRLLYRWRPYALQGHQKSSMRLWNTVCYNLSFHSFENISPHMWKYSSLHSIQNPMTDQARSVTFTQYIFFDNNLNFNLPILFLKSMHCDMWGNCKIFLHFLLFPLLLSAPPTTKINTLLSCDQKHRHKLSTRVLCCNKNVNAYSCFPYWEQTVYRRILSSGTRRCILVKYYQHLGRIAAQIICPDNNLHRSRQNLKSRKP